jgi:hypothetical protein
MRRVFAVAAGLVALGSAATIGATAATGANGPSHARPAATATAKDPQQIADSLTTAAGRARYELPPGALVSATVCVKANCVTKHYRPAPTCASTATTCIGTAMFARRYAGELTITAELA